MQREVPDTRYGVSDDLGMRQRTDYIGALLKTLVKLRPGVGIGKVIGVDRDDLAGILVRYAVAVILNGGDFRFTAWEHDQLHGLRGFFR